MQESKFAKEEREKELLRLIKEESNTQAFNSIYCTYRGRLLLYARTLLSNREDAEDVVQEYFATFWSNRATYDIKTSILPYMLAAIKYKCLNYHRDKTRNRGKLAGYMLSILPGSNHEGGALMEMKEMYKHLTDIISQLPKSERKAAKLSMVEGWKIRDISHQMQIKSTTVSKYLHKTRNTIDDYLEKNFG